MPSASQAHRQIAVGTPLGEDVLLLRSFTYTEQLARPFEMTLDMVSDNSNIKFADIVGQNVTVRLQKPMDDQPRYFNGIVRQFTQMRGSGRTTQYQAIVVPWLWLLTRTADCRIFQDMTVPDILKKIFGDHGMSDFEDRHHATYRKWEYCVQYRETDFDFVSRLMEQEGLYYFFTHENGKHKMVLMDSKDAHEPFPGYEKIPFRPPNLQFREKEHIHEMAVSQEVQPGAYAHTDYDFKSPKKDLHTESKIQRPHAAANFEVFDYPGIFMEHDEGETYSRLRIEELHSGFEVADCETNARGIATGCKFTLVDHPREDLNKDYLVTESTVTASTDEFDSAPGESKGTTFECSFSCIDFQNQFRAARTTDKPMIRGPQTAVVTGPSGEEIHTDKYGRVKVQFFWDRYSKADENSSCWIRVSQTVAGKKWGALSLPRIGHEVIVEFLEGDPDRPIITGRVYNAEEAVPYDLPGSKTMTTLKSNTSKGGAGFNEIRFEDKKDSEQIFVHAQKDQDIRVLNDAKEWIGNDRHLVVKKKQYEKVEQEKHLVVTQDQIEEIQGDRHAHVVGNHNEKVDQTISVTAGMNRQEKVGMNYAMDAGTEIHLKSGMNVVVEAGLMLTLKAGPAFITLGASGVAISGPMVLINSGGSAGSGSGSSPESPKAPVAALVAADDKTGDKGEPPPAPAPPKPVTYKAQSMVLKMAAAAGTPFVKICPITGKPI
jgi:type VI secretion system secreted protein VgrG